MVPPRVACSRVLPLARSGATLTLGLTDPSRSHALEEVRHHCRLNVTPALVSERDMDWSLEHYYRIPTPAPVASDPSPDCAPLPLTNVVSVRAPAGAPAPRAGAPELAGYRPGPAPKPEPGPGPRYSGPGAPSIDEAVELAIPLVTRLVTSGKGYRRPAEPEVRAGKLADAGASPSPSTAGPADPVAAVDSWSGPAASEAGPAPAPSVERRPHRTEGEIIEAIGRAGSRDEIVGCALEYLRRFSERAAFFAVKKEEIRGFDIAGDLTSRDAIRSFWIPSRSQSTLQRISEEKQIHLGPLGRTPADGVLSAALGGRPNRVLVVPVLIGERAAGLLWADGLGVDVPPWSRLERLSDAVSKRLSQLLAKGGRS